MPALGAVSSLVTSSAVGVASDLTSTPDDRARMLPVLSALASLFPGGGLRRGVTVTVRGSTSLLFALLAEATATGSWAAVVGLPDLGLRAAAELGVAIDRVALVRDPGAATPSVVAALLDGMDIVVVDPARLTDSQTRRLSARARNRGAVLVSTGPWPGADLELAREAARWTGLDAGRLAVRETQVRVRGRGAAARPAAATLHLPGPDGALSEAPRHFPAPAPPRRPPLARFAGTGWPAPGALKDVAAAVGRSRAADGASAAGATEVVSLPGPRRSSAPTAARVEPFEQPAATEADGSRLSVAAQELPQQT